MRARSSVVTGDRLAPYLGAWAGAARPVVERFGRSDAPEMHPSNLIRLIPA